MYTKLKQLDKPDLLSNWQKEQIDRGFINEQFFQKLEPIDPWAKERADKEFLGTHIPSLAELKSVNWGTRFRRNRDINQQLLNSKIKSSLDIFKR